ncbi:MAG TPA: hypothetical protein VEA37_04120, partial [Flavobacterium sp.]|nr:hypothetical protein [Flavobacterium sp.]
MIEDYKPRPRLKKVPYGYMVDKEGGDPNLLVPDPAVIGPLDQALDQLDAGISLRSVCDWLNANTPEYANLSHSGLRDLRKEYRPNFVRTKYKPKVKKLTVLERSEKI